MTQSAHYFVAVPVNDFIQQWLEDWQIQLNKDSNVSYKNWTHPNDLHITLKFLGPVPEDKVENLTVKLDQISIKSFNLTIGQLETFGNPNKPRVLFAGVKKTQPLQHLFEKVEETCAQLGFQKESRGYRPHVTLAKKWSGGVLSDTTLMDIQSTFVETKEFYVNHFVVYRINPNKSPKYEVIKVLELT
ncbi:RNA 2',3'-cyclic phosphodiesterase [Aquibacillus halophilus]|uniref:RNA 2',3'-cyclic phosphodiesterase n=1 Tax=Aquibacillus halophilus TaxID=930132 RepID=A0A6A8DAS1_9BACI|nr:RNA 2',3'-cyclic phosphodiesterase [Aquibacillus halophilus]MRH42805.1 RNA 2',3'-cyclic phosphodiesterase [Aquibacillus halophilus]